MVATFASSSKNTFSSHKLNVEAPRASWSVQQDEEKVQVEADTWDTYLGTLYRATVEAIAASSSVQRDYEKVQAEADTWERQLQLGLEDDREDLVKLALWQRNACRDRAHQLKALVERHSVQVSTLKSQMAYWENQV